jgi:hypothetical protein
LPFVITESPVLAFWRADFERCDPRFAPAFHFAGRSGSFRRFLLRVAPALADAFF